MEKIITYVKAILIPVLVGAIVGWIISNFIDYASLQQPPLAPPGSLFPIVWTILYVLMGVSYGILDSQNKINDDINLIYYLQLAVNALWSIFFFVFKWRFFSILWIILLIVLVVRMIRAFYAENRTAGLLQLPYLAWLIFATYLNIGVYLLNR